MAYPWCRAPLNHVAWTLAAKKKGQLELVYMLGDRYR